MAKIKHCIYCGSTVRNQISIKRDAERSGQNGKTGNNQDFEAIQKPAC